MNKISIMKKLIILLFLLSSTLIYGQNFSFVLKNGIDVVDLWQQNPKTVKSLLGRPNKREHSISYTCVLTYISYYKYNDLHLQLYLSSRNKKRRSRKVTTIIVDNLKEYNISKNDIIHKYGQAKFTKENTLFYYFDNKLRRLRVDFIFEDGYLIRLEIYES